MFIIAITIIKVGSIQIEKMLFMNFLVCYQIKSRSVITKLFRYYQTNFLVKPQYLQTKKLLLTITICFPMGFASLNYLYNYCLDLLATQFSIRKTIQKFVKYFQTNSKSNSTKVIGKANWASSN